MLGILRMNIDDCITEYCNMAPKIFPLERMLDKSSLSRLIKAAANKPRFKPEPLEEAIQILVDKYLPDRGAKSRYMTGEGSSGATGGCKV